MADIRLLERTLASNVAWNKARINFVAKFLVALIQVRGVNLVEVTGVFAGRAQSASHYKRAQRFLRFFELPYASVATFVLKLLGVPAPWVLTMDRTDWYLGQTPLNIIVLGVAYKGTAFPVLWTILEKKGCSNTAERCALLDEFGRLFGFSSVACSASPRSLICVPTASLSAKCGSPTCGAKASRVASGCGPTPRLPTHAGARCKPGIFSGMGVFISRRRSLVRASSGGSAGT
jgi:hypothetical protein